MKEIEVFIDTEEIAEFFFQELVKRGYVPTEEELEEIADITFEYLLDKCIIDEEVEEGWGLKYLFFHPLFEWNSESPGSLFFIELEFICYCKNI